MLRHTCQLVTRRIWSHQSTAATRGSRTEQQVRGVTQELYKRVEILGNNIDIKLKQKMKNKTLKKFFFVIFSYFKFLVQKLFIYFRKSLFLK